MDSHINTNIRTVKDLILELQKYPDDTLVGGSDHFGCLMEIEYVTKEIFKDFIEICIEDRGPDPEEDRWGDS